MDDAELAISRSTPGYRFDVAPQPRPVPVAVDGEPPVSPLDPQAAAFVADVVRDQPVVMFALAWCEFCWAVRKLFGKLGVAYESVDLDSVAYQQQDLGVRIRAVLKARTGSPTIPQIYIGGQHIGGCTDLFDAMRSGEMQKRLEAAGISYDRDVQFDPYQLLPKWLHPRQAA